MILLQVELLIYLHVCRVRKVFVPLDVALTPRGHTSTRYGFRLAVPRSEDALRALTVPTNACIVYLYRGVINMLLF